MDDPAFSAALSKLIHRTQVKKRKKRKNNNNSKRKQNPSPSSSSFDLVSMNDTVEVYVYVLFFSFNKRSLPSLLTFLLSRHRTSQTMASRTGIYQMKYGTSGFGSVIQMIHPTRCVS